MPWIIIALIRNTSITLPGIPIASSGINAPPTVALLAASEATMPLADPLPNSSGVRETFLATV